MTEKQNVLKFLEKSLCGKNSQEASFINTAISCVKSSRKHFTTGICKSIQENFSYKICPDQIIGICKNIIKYQKMERKKIGDLSEEDVLLVVLESPNIEEFKGEEPEPAKGKTGVRFCKCLQNIDQIGKFVNRTVILMNPVQNQCSLGTDTYFFRTPMFNRLFDRDNFKNRIRDLCLGRKVAVLLASTYAVKKKISVCLNELEMENIKGLEILPGTYHPSVW